MSCKLVTNVNEWTNQWEGVCISCFDGAPYHSEDPTDMYAFWTGDTEKSVEEFFEDHIKYDV